MQINMPVSDDIINPAVLVLIRFILHILNI